MTAAIVLAALCAAGSIVVAYLAGRASRVEPQVNYTIRVGDTSEMAAAIEQARETHRQSHVRLRPADFEDGA